MAEPGFTWPKAGTAASHSPVWLPRARARSRKGGQRPVLEVLEECSFHPREGWQSSRRGARRGDPSWQDKGWIPGDGGEYGPVGDAQLQLERWVSIVKPEPAGHPGLRHTPALCIPGSSTRLRPLSVLDRQPPTVESCRHMFSTSSTNLMWS